MRKLTKMIFVTDIHTYRQTYYSDLIGPSLAGVQKNPQIKSLPIPKPKSLWGPGSSTHIFTLLHETEDVDSTLEYHLHLHPGEGELTGRIYPGSQAMAFQRSQLLTNCEPWKGIYPWRCCQNITHVWRHLTNITSSNLENVLKRYILHDYPKHHLKNQIPTLWIIEVQIF